MIDIAEIIRKAMERIGCGSAVESDMDVHSPICISLKSLPEIFVETGEDGVRLWSKLPCDGVAQLGPVAADLLEYFLPRQSPAFVCGRALLTWTDDGLVLHGVVSTEYVRDTDRFVDALELFFADLCTTQDMLTQ